MKKKTAPYEEIKPLIQDTAEHRNKEHKEDTCMYRGTDGERFCKMTTNTSCKKCRFYVPTTQAVFRAVYEESVAATDAYYTAKSEYEALTELHDEVQELWEKSRKHFKEAEQAYDLIAMSRKSYLTYLWNEEGKENG